MAPHSLPAIRPALGSAGRLGRTLRQMAAAVRRWYRVAGERLRLGELDDRQLRDLGITRHEAAREARRHFWD